MELFRLIKMCLNETYGKVYIRKHFSDDFPIQNDLKRRDAFSPLLFNFVFKYATMKVQKKPCGTEIRLDTAAAGLR
jgi:hypothetical protein